MATVRFSRAFPSTAVWIFSWIVVSTIPFFPFITPLLQSALADTPYAYLIWVPILSFIWSAWILYHTPEYKDDAELNGVMGMGLLLFCIFILVIENTLHPLIYVAQSHGLLLWPIWVLGMAWLMFGVGHTKRLIRPITYLWLSWPPLYTKFILWTQPTLDSLANGMAKWLSHQTTWFHVTSTSGEYLAFVQQHRVTVDITSACSGADSFLAMVILFPIVLVAYKGRLHTKLCVILAGAILAVLSNLLRILIVLISLHSFGESFSFGILHPIAGSVLFVVILISVGWIGKALGLTPQRTTGKRNLVLPGRVRGGLAFCSAMGLCLCMWPMYVWGAGALNHPIDVPTNRLDQLVPVIPGIQGRMMNRYDDSSVLGSGAHDIALLYSSSEGRPGSVMAQLWWTYDASMFNTYGVQNCLLFHGITIIDKKSLKLKSGIPLEIYAIKLPPTVVGGPSDVFLDWVFTYSVNYQSRKAYIRVEMAAPVHLQVSQNNRLMTSMNSILIQLTDPSFPENMNFASLNKQDSARLRWSWAFVDRFSNQLLSR